MVHKREILVGLRLAYIDASRVEFEEAGGDAEEVLVDGHARVGVGHQARRKVHDGRLHPNTCTSIKDLDNEASRSCRGLFGCLTCRHGG